MASKITEVAKSVKGAGTVSVKRPGRKPQTTQTQAEPAQPQTRAQVVQAAQAESTQSQSQSQLTQVPATQATQAPPEKLSTLAECLPSGENMSMDDLTIYLDTPFGLQVDVINLFCGHRDAVSPRLTAFARWLCSELSAINGEAFDDVMKTLVDAKGRAYVDYNDLCAKGGDPNSMNTVYYHVKLENGVVQRNKDGSIMVGEPLSDKDVKIYEQTHPRS